MDQRLQVTKTVSPFLFEGSWGPSPKGKRSPLRRPICLAKSQRVPFRLSESMCTARGLFITLAHGFWDLLRLR